MFDVSTQVTTSAGTKLESVIVVTAKPFDVAEIVAPDKDAVFGD